jgi:anti-sigma-K factor RskA
MSARRRKLDPLDVVLGEVRPEDGAEAARLTREDADFRREVERLAPIVARLERQPAETWEAPDPPPLVVGVPLRVGRRRRRLPSLVLRAPAAVAASLALLVAGAVGGVMLAGDGDPGREERRVALDPLPGGEGEAVLVEREGGRVRLVARGLAPDARGFHELWLLPAEGDPVPVGRFRAGADGRAEVTLRLPADPRRFEVYDVSVEPDDGDPAHSGRSVLRAPV